MEHPALPKWIAPHKLPPSSQLLPELKDLVARGLFLSHTFGEGNALADAASRGKYDALKALARRLGLHAQKVLAP